MNFRTLDDFEFEGKRVLLRIDINSEISKGEVILSDRIIEHSRTILELQKEGARVIVIAHQGRPGEKDCISLRQHSKLLNKYVKVKFVGDIIGEKAMEAAHGLKNGEAVLLENVRFLKDEFDTNLNTKFVKTLASLSDIYIDDAFSIAHREQASIVSFPRVLSSGVGRVMEEELRNLDRLKIDDALYVLGGAKIEDVMLLLKHKPILPGGVLAPLYLIAKGYDLGYESKVLKEQLKYVPLIKKHINNFIEPVDLAVSVKGKREEISVFRLPSHYQILDIGSRTIARYRNEIMKSKAVFVKGTMGYCEGEEFCKGTKGIMEAVAKSKGFKVLSGGHTTTALRKFKISKRKFDYISLSGGALIHYIAGEKLPGLEVLRKRK